jgi:sucrose-6-phosphate hydrolase SacC (GH32 family)
MDKESIELFINGGERVLTSLIPTPLSADGITLAADAPLKISVEAHPLG